VAPSEETDIALGLWYSSLTTGFHPLGAADQDPTRAWSRHSSVSSGLHNVRANPLSQCAEARTKLAKGFIPRNGSALITSLSREDGGRRRQDRWCPRIAAYLQETLNVGEPSSASRKQNGMSCSAGSFRRRAVLSLLLLATRSFLGRFWLLEWTALCRMLSRLKLT
jgi:hypothetical protein